MVRYEIRSSLVCPACFEKGFVHATTLSAADREIPGFEPPSDDGLQCRNCHHRWAVSIQNREWTESPPCPALTDAELSDFVPGESFESWKGRQGILSGVDGLPEAVQELASALMRSDQPWHVLSEARDCWSRFNCSIDADTAPTRDELERAQSTVHMALDFLPSSGGFRRVSPSPSDEQMFRRAADRVSRKAEIAQALLDGARRHDEKASSRLSKGESAQSQVLEKVKGRVGVLAAKVELENARLVEVDAAHSRLHLEKRGQILDRIRKFERDLGKMQEEFQRKQVPSKLVRNLKEKSQKHAARHKSCKERAESLWTSYDIAWRRVYGAPDAKQLFFPGELFRIVLVNPAGCMPAGQWYIKSLDRDQ